MDAPIELLTQALLGELSEEERHRFEAWLQEDSHRLLWEKFRQNGYFEQALSELQGIDAPAAYQDFLRTRNRYRIRKWMKYAAIVLPFGVLLGWGVRQALKTDRNSVIQPVAEVAQIDSGISKARLILDDGTQCDLGENEYQLREGEVNVKVSNGKLQYENKGESGTEVKYNTLVVPRGGEYTLALSDGTVVSLNSGTRLRYPVSFVGDTRTVRVSGEAYFEVAEDAGHPFVVQTADLQVKVLGTGFNVSAYPDESESAITLVHGKVGVETDRQQVFLRPDEQYVCSTETHRGTVRKVDAAQYIAWKEGILHFDQMPLEELGRKLGRWYSVDFSFASEQLKSLRFSGAFKKYNTLQYVLKIIEEITDVRFTIEDNTVIVHNK